MEEGAPLGLAVISVFNGLEVDGWLNEARGLWSRAELEDAGVEGCDIIEGVVGSGEFEEGSLKEKFEVNPAEGSLPNVKVAALVTGAVVEAGLSVIDGGV